MKNIQKEVDDWISQYKVGYFPPFEMMARITEEVGELAREISHRYGLRKSKPKILSILKRNLLMLFLH